MDGDAVETVVDNLAVDNLWPSIAPNLNAGVLVLLNRQVVKEGRGRLDAQGGQAVFRVSAIFDGRVLDGAAAGVIAAAIV